MQFCFQTNFKLRCLAKNKDPNEAEFKKLANSVDQFTSCFLDPLKSNAEARHAFGDSLDDVMDAGIEWEQKKVLKRLCRSNNKWIVKNKIPSVLNPIISCRCCQTGKPVVYQRRALASWSLFVSH